MTQDPARSEHDDLLRAWCDALLAELATLGPPSDGGLLAVDIDAVLGLAGSMAHAVVRPAAPLTTYLVGLAVGRATAAGWTLEEAYAAAAALARTLAETGEFAPGH